MIGKSLYVREYEAKIEALSKRNDILQKALEKANATLVDQLFKLATLGDKEASDRISLFLKFIDIDSEPC